MTLCIRVITYHLALKDSRKMDTDIVGKCDKTDTTVHSF